MIVGEARTPKGLRIYAIGDIHGCIDPLKTLVGMIDRDLAEQPAPRHVIVFLGDYVDRGPANRQVIDYLIELHHSNRECVFINGNHDDRFLGIYKHPELIGPEFLKWGGVATLRDYGIVQNPGEEINALHFRAGKAIPRKHVEFLQNLQNYYQSGDYFFCHAGVRPGVALDDQSAHDLVWIRQDFLQYKKPYEKVVIHGHTPHRKPEVKKNRINVDTYCYETGNLTALVLEGNSQRFLHTAAPGA